MFTYTTYRKTGENIKRRILYRFTIEDTKNFPRDLCFSPMSSCYAAWMTKVNRVILGFKQAVLPSSPEYSRKDPRASKLKLVRTLPVRL